MCRMNCLRTGALGRGTTIRCRTLFALTPVLAAVLAVGCGTPTAVPDVADGQASLDAVDADAAPPPPPPRICRSGRTWSPGMPAFEERTADWNLAGLNGNSFGVADIDGDGFADLVHVVGGVYDRAVGHAYLNRAGANGRRTFVDHTMASGIFAVRDSSEIGRSISYITFGDIDNDGDLDAFTAPFLYATSPSREPLTDGHEVMLNDGHGVFTLTAAQTVTGPPTPLSSSAFLFDQNLDGRLDLAVGYWWRQPAFTEPFGDQPQLFRGDGTGAFSDVTDSAGMTLGFTPASVLNGTNARPLFGLVMCDVNNDGRTDIVGAAYGRMFNELFVANGDRFSEIGAMTQVGSDDRRDFSDDESFRCYCVTHATATGCAGLPAPRYRCPLRGWTPGQSDQPRNLGGNTFSYACEDVDNDGDFDLYESNIRHPDVGSASDPSELLVNDGTAGAVHFTRPGRDTMGLVPPITLANTDEGGQHNAAWDFDNDGRMDLYLAGSPYPRNRGWMFHQRSEGTLQFEFIGRTSGFDHACPNGTALADFDHDGDLDMIVGTYGCNDPASLPAGQRPDYEPPTNQPIRVYENVSNDANWISIRLVGRGGMGGSNRSGLGARVRVTAGGVTQSRLVHGSSQNVASEAVAFFGLGGNCDIERIEVRWPNAALTVQTFTGVLANYRVEIREGETSARYLP